MIVADKTGCMVFEFIPIHNDACNDNLDKDYFDDIYKKDVITILYQYLDGFGLEQKTNLYSLISQFRPINTFRSL